MNIQFIRKIIEKDQDIQNYIKDTYWDSCIIKYSNFWFILVLDNYNYVIKYYLPDDYLSDLNINIESNFFLKEKNNYILFKEKWILIPTYIWSWQINIWKYLFNYAKIENIRISNNKINNFNQIEINKLYILLKDIHAIKKWYINWNIHTSNFFETSNWNIWIFDLVSYENWNIENDLARICLWYNFEYKYCKDFLFLYWVKKINFKLLLIEVYRCLKDNTLFNHNKSDIHKLIILIKKYIWVIKE